MKIIFKEEDRELGTEEYSNILETLIPAHKENGPSIFITKRFASAPDTSIWNILGIEAANNIAEIKLEAKEGQISLEGYAKSQSKKAKGIVGQFCIVDVDFGFYSNIFTKDKPLSRNERYREQCLPGELHKKRPCIVWDVHNNRVRIIPLTTNDAISDRPNKVLIGRSSFDGMGPHYQEANSYALIDMLQTVSTSRVFTPRGAGQKISNNYRRFKLKAADQSALSSALEQEHAKRLHGEKTKLDLRLASLEAEKRKLLATIREQKADAAKHQAIIEQLAEFWETDSTAEALLSSIES